MDYDVLYHNISFRTILLANRYSFDTFQYVKSINYLTKNCILVVQVSLGPKAYKKL